MFRHYITVCLCLIPTALFSAENQPVEYDQDIAPIFKKYCAGCHNDGDLEGDFSLESFAALTKGTPEGPVFVPGKSGKSNIIRLLKSQDDDAMPPEDEPRPSQAEIAKIEQWISEGAKPPKNMQPDRLKLSVKSIVSHAKINPITAMDISPDARHLAVGYFGRVELFVANDKHKFDTTKPAQVLSDFPGKVTAVHFSQDGTQVVCASGVTGLGGYALLCNVADGSTVCEIKGHRDVLYDAELSPDGLTIATCGYDQNIILWDAITGSQIRQFKGHNGAVYDIGFSPNGKLLVSGSADETCKVWRVSDAVRLDTLPQPLEAVYCCAFTPDGKRIVAGGADNNLRVWQVRSTDKPKINPMVIARYAHEGDVLQFKFTADGSRLVSLSKDRSVKVWDTRNFSEIASWKNQPDVSFAMATNSQTDTLQIGRMNGSLQQYKLPPVKKQLASQQTFQEKPGVAMSGEMKMFTESEPNNLPKLANQVEAPVTISGQIHSDDPSIDFDLYQFAAKKGQQWVIETNAGRAKSSLDSFIEVLDISGNSIPRVQLQAVRDSYFTFRGKDDATTGDFRVFNWQEMSLDEYLYSNGEVAKLWLYPRGPDSGFIVYPGQGKRWGYFGTTPLAHALGEPCYVVKPYSPEVNLVPNGLPVFMLYYENDDESRRKLGTDSRLIFTAPADGQFLVKIKDVRGAEGDNMHYKLSIRPRKADFKPTVHGKDIAVPAGGAKEFKVTVDRLDEYDGPIQFEFKDLPAGFSVSGPIIIEAGQIEARGVIMAAADALAPDEKSAAASIITATATINGKKVTHKVNNFGKLSLKPDSKLAIFIVPAEKGIQPIKTPEDGPMEFEIHAGETIMLKVIATRKGHTGLVPFGKQDSGRNLPFGSYVDNIGLSGLLILNNQNERNFFITADYVTKPQSRLVHLNTTADGGHASLPILLHVLPRE
ncbi:MAG: hypothetical protein COA78_04835 [Blastopirellula sp.]|nr:MAG: hypothetical protein COA78_04835 [Blastopirellula sp.]